MNNYSELLKDPRWQKKRLEIFNRDKFRCRTCSSDVKTLNVHHLIYLRNTEPWDYPNELLFTVCEGCHKLIRKVDFAGQLVTHILKHGADECLRQIIENPIMWVIVYEIGNYTSFKEVYDVHNDLSLSG